MTSKHNKHLSYGVGMELDFLCGKINVNEYIRRTYIDRETLAKCSGRSLIETVEFIAYGNKSLIEYSDMIVAEVRRSISVEFEDSHVTCAKKYIQGRVDYWRRCYNTQLLC